MSSLYKILIILSMAWAGAVPVACGEDVPGTTPSKWPGVKFGISKVIRLDGNLVLMAVKISADATAPAKTLIGTPPLKGTAPKDVNPRDVHDYLPGPFVLTSAYLMSPATKEKFAAQPGVPELPFLGPNSICTNLEQGGWLQLAVVFKAPPEVPPTPEGEAPQPKVDVYLPNTVAPIKGIEIPKKSPASS